MTPEQIMVELTADNWIDFIITEIQDYKKGEMTQRGLVSDLDYIVEKLKSIVLTDNQRLIDFMIKQKDN